MSFSPFGHKFFSVSVSWSGHPLASWILARQDVIKCDVLAVIGGNASEPRKHTRRCCQADFGSSSRIQTIASSVAVQQVQTSKSSSSLQPSIARVYLFSRPLLVDFSATWCVDCLQSAGTMHVPWYQQFHLSTVKIQILMTIQISIVLNVPLALLVKML